MAGLVEIFFLKLYQKVIHCGFQELLEVYFPNNLENRNRNDIGL